MACSFSKVKCYLSCFLLIAFSYHIFNTCPIGKPLDYELLESDPVCKVTHQAYAFILPYAAPALESFNEKVVVPAYDKYETSPVKPIVDKAAVKSTEIYVQHGKPLVDKYYPIAQEQAFKYSEFAKQKSVHYYEVTSAFAKENGEIYGKIAKEKSIEAYGTTSHALKTKVFPTLYIYYDIVKAKTKEYATKAIISVYFNYKFYLQPHLEAGYAKFLESPAGPYWKQFLNSVAYHYIQTTFFTCVEGVKYFINYLEESIKAFQADEFKLSEDIQHKSEFLKHEFNKILGAGFKIPSYEDYDFFKKLAKTNEAASEATTDSSSFVAANTASPAPVPTSQKYEDLLKKVIDDALNDFSTQTKKLSDESIVRLSEEPREKLRELSKLTNGVEYDEAHRLLVKINDKEAVPQVSRQDYRDVLSKHSKAITDAGNAAQDQIIQVEKELKDSVSDIRKSILDGFSEFSESTLSAYSADIINKGDNWEEWKKFNDIKKELMGVRDQILSSDPISEDFKKTLGSVKNTINILLNDGQSYLAILRAKANIEFQSREKAERQAAASASAAASAAAKDEENETTSTVEVTRTVVLGDDGEPVTTQEPTTSETVATEAPVVAKEVEEQIPLKVPDEEVEEQTPLKVQHEEVEVESSTTETTETVKETIASSVEDIEESTEETEEISETVVEKSIELSASEKVSEAQTETETETETTKVEEEPVETVSSVDAEIKEEFTTVATSENKKEEIEEEESSVSSTLTI